MRLIAEGKIINSMPIKNLFNKDEHNAETIEFEIPKQYEEITLENCTFIISGINSNNNRIEQVLEKDVLDDKIILTWIVYRDFTAVPGALELEIRGVVTVLNDEMLVIKFTMSPIEIQGSDIETTNDLSVDIIEQAINNFQTTVDEGLTTFQTFVNQQITDTGYPYIILTQSEYDAIENPDSSKLYVITGD